MLSRLPDARRRQRSCLRSPGEVRRARLLREHQARSLATESRLDRAPGRRVLPAGGTVTRAARAGGTAADQDAGGPRHRARVRRRWRDSGHGGRIRRAARCRGCGGQGPHGSSAGSRDRRRHAPAAHRCRCRHRRIRHTGRPPGAARDAGRAAPPVAAGGSMGPKVEAACRFVEATGRLAAIGRLDDAAALLGKRAGTVVEP